jgi:hypothetical protein
MAGINFTDEQEYAPKLSFKNNEVLPLVSNSVCECVYEYNDDHHGICVWQCPKCEAEENEQTDCTTSMLV